MPIPNINEYGYQGCLFIGSDYTVIDRLPDGTVEAHVDLNQGNGPEDWFPTPIGTFCCGLLNASTDPNSEYYGGLLYPQLSGHTYTWDEDRQECRWQQYVDCNALPPFSVVLNPQDNSGALFEVQPEETCELNVEFDYMFKFDCQDIMDVQADSVSDTLTNLYNDLDLATNECISRQEELDNLPFGWNYVLEYNGFDPNTPLPSIYFCVTEAGLPLLESTINDVYGAGYWDIYLSGGINIYEIDPAVVWLMVIANSENQNLFLEECTEDGLQLLDDSIVWLTTRDGLIQDLEDCGNTITLLNEQINLILNQNAENCIYAIDTFEELVVNMAIDIQDPTQPNVVNTVYTEEIFNIGAGNLVNYMATNAQNPMYIDGFDWRTCDFDECDSLATILVQQMIDQALEGGLLSGTTYYSQYNQLIDLVGTFGPTWFHYSGTISDPAIISGITGQDINLSLQIADSCVNFSILLDQIELNKVCERVVNNEIIVNTNPSFDIRKECDNKKSWVVMDTPEERDYTLFMRNTDYDVNDSRLVLNTKEIDLNVSIDNGIETDVWCYVNDNPCILEPCGDVTTTVITSGTCVAPITGVTNWTGGTTALPSVNLGTDPQYAGSLLRIQQAGDGTIASSAFTTEYSGCSFVHKIDRSFTVPWRFTGSWIVGQDDGMVYWYLNQTISGNTDLTRYYGDTLTQTNCNDIGTAITAYNTFNGTDYQTIYWDGVGCVFDQVLTGATTATTITDDCCCDIPPLSGTNITGGTVALPPTGTSVPCSITTGDTGPGGGLVFWLDPNNPCQGLEMNVADLSTSTRWSPVVVSPTFIWADNNGLFSGQTNTDIIVNEYPVPPNLAYAASLCDDLVNGGQNDWYLPNVTEWDLMYDALAGLPPTIYSGGTYWTSLEVYKDDSANYNAATGVESTVNKGNLYAVKAIRRFELYPCDEPLTVLTNATSFEQEGVDCSSWIYKFNIAPQPSPDFIGYWVAGMPDGTVGVFEQVIISGVTASTLDYTPWVTQECCEDFNTAIQNYATVENMGDHLIEFKWDANCEQCKFTKCEKPQCVDFTELLTSPVTGITTVKAFNDVITSELINARCRQTSSSYPTLRALYERYMNSTEYCDTQSSAFDYFTMSDFGNLVGTYWVDLFEQVIPSTTIWCANHIHGNTIYDQQKFKYRGHSLYPCGIDANSGAPVEAPTGFTWTASGAADVDIYTISNDEVCTINTTCTSGVYYITGDCGSEFLGRVTDTPAIISP